LLVLTAVEAVKAATAALTAVAAAEYYWKGINSTALH
jgi:hypothetical protein